MDATTSGCSSPCLVAAIQWQPSRSEVMSVFMEVVMDPDAALKQLTTAIQGAVVLDVFMCVVTMIAMMLSDSMWLFPILWILIGIACIGALVSIGVELARWWLTKDV